MMSRKCKWCDSNEHTQFFCRLKPRTPIKTYTQLKKIGSVGKATEKAVSKWKRQQQPNHQGYFVCYMCGQWTEYLTAEHVKSKVRRPDLRTNPENFKPTCNPCNDKKRSN